MAATRKTKRERLDLDREWVAAAENLFDPLLLMAEDPRRPLFPLDTAGMPKPGPDFDRLAQAMLNMPPPPLVTKGMSKEQKEAARAEHFRLAERYAADYDNALIALYRDALYSERFTMDVEVKGRKVPAPFVSGTTYDSVKTESKWADYGPIHPYDVMVVSKYPGNEEVRKLMNFVGGSSETLFRALHELGMATIRRVEEGEGFDRKIEMVYEDLGEVADWYFTNVCKHPGLDPSTTGLAASWTKNCAPLLEQELRLVRPRFILCFGTEAAKAILGKKASVGRMFGRIVEKRIPLRRDGAPPSEHQWHTAQVMACVHPAYVGKKPEAYVDLVNGLGSFRQLIRGKRIGDAESGLRHVCLYTERALAAVVDEIIAESTGTDVIAVDAEWHGDLPGEAGAYLRTVQFSHKAKHGFCVVLHSQGGVPAFEGGVEAAFRQLRRLLKSTPERRVRVGGHFFRADLPWLLHHGLDVRDEYEVARTPKGTRTKGGWDTGFMVAARIGGEGDPLRNRPDVVFCGIQSVLSKNVLRRWTASPGDLSLLSQRRGRPSRMFVTERRSGE